MKKYHKVAGFLGIRPAATANQLASLADCTPQYANLVLRRLWQQGRVCYAVARHHGFLKNKRVWVYPADAKYFPSYEWNYPEYVQEELPW